MSMLYRKSKVYKDKLMRIGAALRRFSNVSGSENNLASLSTEADALEELSLSTFSLMKAIKAEILAAAKKGAAKDSCIIIRPGDPLFDDVEPNK